MINAIREQLADLSLTEVADRIASKELSPIEVTRAALERIESIDGMFNAFITVLGERALAEAQQAEAEILSGRYRGQLHGVPISVKDLFWTRGIRTTAGSRILSQWIPDEDATIVQRLHEAGAVLIGKTNMLEFAYAAVHPDFGPTPNPWDISRSSSGSSSGSAVAVAAGMGYGSIGSDTGGSIRLPASYCGIVGLKPTYGLVSRHGAVPVSWSCDHVGPMTRSVDDARVLLAAIAGNDLRDPTSAHVPAFDYRSMFNHGLGRIRIGYSDAYLSESASAEVQRLVKVAMNRLDRLGASIEPVKLPRPYEAVAALLAIITPEATVYHLPWLKERPNDYTRAVRERLELGAITPAVNYIQAQRVRRHFTDQFLEVMDTVDILVMPTAPTAATPLEGDLVTKDEADPALLAAVMNFTGPFNLTGFPAISLPCGFTENGLPVGLQLVGRPFAEAELLAVAHAYEQSTAWHKRLPTEVASRVNC